MNPSIERFENRGFALKKEVTEGTDSVPTALVDAFQLIDGKSSIKADSLDRKLDRPYMNARRKKFSNFRAEVEGTIELVPPAVPGTGKASVGLGLQIAGMAETLAVGPPAKTVYTPISKLIPSATGYFWHAGTLKKMVGARANISSLDHSINKWLTAQIKIEGGCAALLTEDALPTTFDFTAFTEPTIATTENMELLINGFAVNGLSHMVEFGNDLKTMSHTEARRSFIGDRDSTVKLRFYRTLKADFDPHAKWKAGDLVTAKSTTAEADLRATVLTSQFQVTDVQEVEIDKEYGWEISGILVATGATGGNELEIAFTKP